MSQRKARVEHALRDVLSELVRREVRDPRVARVGLVSITRVELNVDLSVANVYVSIVGGTQQQAEAAVLALGRAAKFLRGPAGRELNLAHPPELRFLLDRSADMHDRLRDVIREDEAKARAAGRQVGAALGTDVAGAALPPSEGPTAAEASGAGSEPGPEEGR